MKLCAASCVGIDMAPRALVLALLASSAPARADDRASCVDDAKPLSIDALRAQVSRLADAELDGRTPGSDGDRAARAALVERFRCLGLTPGAGDGFEQPFDHTANVIGVIPGADPDVGQDLVVIGAHHDHLGHGYPGANDNASGVAALLAIAQGLRQGDPPRRTVVFVAFGEEEEGELGSQYLVAHPPVAVPLDRIVQYVNLDMVGSYDSKGYVAAMGTFDKLPARTLTERAVAKISGLHVGLGGRSSRSDHEAFCKIGVPYVFFWTPDDRCYHAKCDTVANIDFPHMAKITRVAGDLVRALADTKLDLARSRNRLGCSGR